MAELGECLPRAGGTLLWYFPCFYLFGLYSKTRVNDDSDDIAVNNKGSGDPAKVTEQAAWDLIMAQGKSGLPSPVTGEIHSLSATPHLSLEMSSGLCSPG